MSARAPNEEVRRQALERVRRLVVKVGSSTVAHPTGCLNRGRMAAIARAVVDLWTRGLEVVLVSSGAIAAGMGRLGRTVRPDDLSEQQALAAVGQGVLIETYHSLFAELGRACAQILVTADDLSTRRRRENVRATFERLLGWQVVPIVNENDTVATEEIRVGDNDTLSAQVAVLLGADLLVLLTDRDGLYTNDPGLDPAAELIRVVRAGAKLPGVAGGPLGQLGTGGMRTKVSAARIAAQAGIPTVIASGHAPENLGAIVEGASVGTLILPETAAGSAP